MCCPLVRYLESVNLTVLARILSRSLRRVKSGFGYPMKTSGEVVPSIPPTDEDYLVRSKKTIASDLCDEITQLECYKVKCEIILAASGDCFDKKGLHEIHSGHPHVDKSNVKDREGLCDDIIATDNDGNRCGEFSGLIVPRKCVSLA